jgi:hypothetical protein
MIISRGLVNDCNWRDSDNWTFFLYLAPFICFLFLFFWGGGVKKRKQSVYKRELRVTWNVPKNVMQTAKKCIHKCVYLDVHVIWNWPCREHGRIKVSYTLGTLIIEIHPINKHLHCIQCIFRSFCFVFGKFRVQISAQRPDILTENFRGFPHSLLAKAGIVT